jgi:hypothetical protein
VHAEWHRQVARCPAWRGYNWLPVSEDKRNFPKAALSLSAMQEAEITDAFRPRGVDVESMQARTVVLLGDPQQLDQPMQGSHLEGADTSALHHLLDSH